MSVIGLWTATSRGMTGLDVALGICPKRKLGMRNHASMALPMLPDPPTHMEFVRRIHDGLFFGQSRPFSTHDLTLSTTALSSSRLRISTLKLHPNSPPKSSKSHSDGHHPAPILSISLTAPSCRPNSTCNPPSSLGAASSIAAASVCHARPWPVAP